MKRICMLIAACLAGVAVLSAQAQLPPGSAAQPPTPAPLAGAGVASPEYKIGPKDVLTVEVANDTLILPLGKTYQVQADGRIALGSQEKLSAVPVAGKTIAQVQEDVEKRLEEANLLGNPTVTVRIVEFHSQIVTVSGEFNSPGQKSIGANQMTLMAAVFAGGGLTARADPEVQVRRNRPPATGPRVTDARDEKTELRFMVNMLDLNEGRIEDPPLQDGDIVYAAQAKSCTVNGEVKTPGQVVLKKGMTVLEAIMKAGGPNDKGAMNRVSIKRMGVKKPGVYGVINKVPETMVVQPDDIINVPKKYIGLHD